MNIILSNTDSAPIYEQITRQLRAKIVSGELTAGQALPSMRLLARERQLCRAGERRAAARGTAPRRGGASGAGGTRGEAGRTDRGGVHGDRTNGF